MDIEYTNRLKDDLYYGKPPEGEEEDNKSLKAIFNLKERKEEIKEFERRVELIQLLEDLGQKEIPMCDTELIYTLRTPTDSAKMAENLRSNKYPGKLILKEISLFSGSL
jgi:hypothetical protein